MITIEYDENGRGLNMNLWNKNKYSNNNNYYFINRVELFDT